jgi:hypothetical protein
MSIGAPGEWPREIFVCPVCGQTLGSGAARNADAPACPDHDDSPGLAVEVTLLQADSFEPGADPRRRPGWTKMSDEARESAMANYLNQQARQPAS